MTADKRRQNPIVYKGFRRFLYSNRKIPCGKKFIDF